MLPVFVSSLYLGDSLIPVPSFRAGHLCRLFGRGGAGVLPRLSFSLRIRDSCVLTNSRARCRAGSSMYMARCLMGAVVPGSRVLQS